jgi:DNA-binding GntR family transcriptional regulator
MTEPPRFERESVVPLYVQAADYVAAKIATGELAPGQRLPSERDLAIEWGIGYLTARHAMKELKARGLVVSAIGKGTFVAS